MKILRFLRLPNLVRKIISGLLSLILFFVPNSMYTSIDETSEYMLTGDETFSYNGEEWTVGFAKEVLTPDDITEENVEDYLMEHWDEYPLPKNASYVHCSDELDTENIRFEED